MWGIIPVEVLKVRELEVAFKLLSLQAEARSLKFLPDCMSCAGVRVCGENVSQPFLSVLMWVFPQLSDM